MFEEVFIRNLNLGHAILISKSHQNYNSLFDIILISPKHVILTLELQLFL
jgi:hypothetical protein